MADGEGFDQDLIQYQPVLIDLPDTTGRQAPITRFILSELHGMLRKLGVSLLYGAGVIAGGVAIWLILIFGTGFFLSAKTDGPILVSPLGGGRSGATFLDLPLERRIASTSVIATARFDTRGDNSKCRISEILRLAPGTRFGFVVGDSYPYCHQYKKGGDKYQEGIVMFFFGDPPDLQGVAFFEGNEVSQLGGMTLSDLREKARRANTSSRPQN